MTYWIVHLKGANHELASPPLRDAFSALGYAESHFRPLRYTTITITRYERR